MKYVYIDMKTELSSGSIRTVANQREQGYSLDDPETGDFILQLPKEIKEIPHSGTVYEDAAILIRT